MSQGYMWYVGNFRVQWLSSYYKVQTSNMKYSFLENKLLGIFLQIGCARDQACTVWRRKILELRLRLCHPSDSLIVRSTKSVFLPSRQILVAVTSQIFASQVAELQQQKLQNMQQLSPTPNYSVISPKRSLKICHKYLSYYVGGSQVTSVLF